MNKSFVSLNSLCCLLLVAGIAFTGCAPKGQVKEEKPPQYFPLASNEINLPESVAGFHRGEVSSYADQRLGVAVGYVTSETGVRADVYVYPIVLPELYSLADMNELEFQHAVSDVLTVMPGAEVKEVSEFSGSYDGKNYAALKARIKLDGATRADSFVYLSITSDAYVKIRFTEHEDMALKINPDDFAKRIMAEVAFKHPEKRTRELGVTITRGATELAGNSKPAFGYMILVGARLMEQISSGNYLDTFQREYQVVSEAFRSCMDVYAKDIGSQPMGSFLDGMREAEQAGYMREYVWNYFRRPYWSQPEGLKMAEFKVWAEARLSGHIAPVNHGVLVTWQES